MLLFAPLLIAAGSPQTAIDAERAFAAKAQSDGQWAAFRAFAAPEAIMFVPEPTNAQAWLNDREEPPFAVLWWPEHTIISCDGSLAVNTGPWVRQAGSFNGTFTTVWERRVDGGWHWLLDHGRSTPRPVAAGEEPSVDRASCDNLSAIGRDANFAYVEGEQPLRHWALNPAATILVQFDDRMPASGLNAAVKFAVDDMIASGHSPDRTIVWDLASIVGAQPGAHLFRLRKWTGSDYETVLLDVAGVPAQ